MSTARFQKSWLLCTIDGDPALSQIQRHDRLMLLATDAEAVRRARCEARRGKTIALHAVALHQHAKCTIRSYLRPTSKKGGVP
jgi:hypothetical protein